MPYRGWFQSVPAGAGSYQKAYDNIPAIFAQVYPNSGNKPHPGIGAWGIFNEYDYNNIDPVNVAFTIQAILKLEAAAGVTAADRLPFMVPASNAVNSNARDAWFQTAQALYRAIPNANPSIPPGVLANIADPSRCRMHSSTAQRRTAASPSLRCRPTLDHALHRHGESVHEWTHDQRVHH